MQMRSEVILRKVANRQTDKQTNRQWTNKLKQRRKRPWRR